MVPPLLLLKLRLLLPPERRPPPPSRRAGASGGGSPAEAIQAVADGVTQCKFEATYPASDECVLHRILDVLVAVVGCPAGPLLTNDNLINIFQVL